MHDATPATAPSSVLPTPLPVLAINLDRDTDRWQALHAAFTAVAGVALRRQAGVLGSLVPAVAQQQLTRRPQADAGALGCFLAHVGAWEAVAKGVDWALIVEDDARPVGFEALHRAPIPADADLVFVNARAEPASQRGTGVGIEVLPVVSLLRHKADPSTRRAPPGSDGYLLSPRGAAKLIDAVVKEGFAGHIDWRLLRYSVRVDEVPDLVEGTFIAERLPFPPAPRRAPMLWGVLTAYCLSPAVIVTSRGASSRKAVTAASSA